MGQRRDTGWRIAVEPESSTNGRADAEAPDYWMRADGARIAYRRVPGRAPTVVFLGGFSSDMSGTKAVHLDAWCRARGQAYLRFDYQGHGSSSGRFLDGTIGSWRDDALTVIEGCTEGPLILVGSSMGAWIMLLVACALPQRIQALVGLASAPDFTEELIWGRLPGERRLELEREGVIRVPSDYANEDTPITRGLIEDGRRHLLLGGRIPITCPVRLLHGMQDGDVPWSVAGRLLEALASTDVTLELVKSGDHRLSTPSDLARIAARLGELLAIRCDAQ
jgi:pimeloyl-ACP methyl ester carboxylesterase